MKNPIVQPPEIVRKFFPNCLWRLPVGKNQIALTFDDGPIPEQTLWVLDLLKKENIHATFFCVGENIERHPEIFQQIIAEGHSIGNHTYSHMKMFPNKFETYMDNVRKCCELEQRSDFFRPPHGQIYPWKVSAFKQFRKIVFWDVMPMDYDKNLTPEAVFDNVKLHLRDGSIIVLHDSIKAGNRMRYCLENTIKFAKENNYQFVTF